MPRTAVCPHLGAILQWNNEEKSFDCPMHGSRFTTDGKVINGGDKRFEKNKIKEEKQVKV
ncbi:MAG: Rieske 2Fe-2S domain-containing protein [Chitinophagaceae bacterium]